MELDTETEDSAAAGDVDAGMDTSEGVSSRPKRTIKVNIRLSFVNTAKYMLILALIKVPRKNSLDANAGGEDILVNPRRKNPGVGVKMTREVILASHWSILVILVSHWSILLGPGGL